MSLLICPFITLNDEQKTVFGNVSEKGRYLLKKVMTSISSLTDIGLSVNSDKTEFMSFEQDGALSTLNYNPQKLVDYFLYLGSNTSSTENHVNIHGLLLIVYRPSGNLTSNKIKLEFFKAFKIFFQSGLVIVLLYGWITWTLSKHIEKKKLEANCAGKLRDLLNEFWKQYLTSGNATFLPSK